RLFVETFSETGTFWFTQAADPQLGLMQPLRKGKCDGEGEGWTEEVPMFMVLCCDLAFPGYRVVFTGHYHQNAGGCHDGLDTHGVRVVVVTAYSQGTDQDFRELLQV
uniref:Uncharacterized protein n=1 Tax=Cyprinodon variegatus TaxID=28743 RepID=A0A3Q2FJE6_CYPVA